MRYLIGILCIALMFTAAVPLHQGMVTLHESYPTEFRSYYIPSSDYLRIASLGQRNFWADLIFIWSVQFFDRYAESVRDTYLFHTFQVITDLDPRFTEAYIFGNLFLSLDRRYDLIYQLSDKGLAKNPKDWILAWDAGTYAFFQEKNYSQALKYFLLAEERNPDNTLVQDLLANSYKYRGDYESSLRYWQGILEKYKDVDTERGHFFAFAAARNIFDLTIKIDLQKLTVAVESYRKAHGSNPPNLRTLAGEGFLKVIPVDPEGKAYLYDPVTGEVSCQTPFKFRGKYAQW